MEQKRLRTIALECHIDVQEQIPLVIRYLRLRLQSSKVTFIHSFKFKTKSSNYSFGASFEVIRFETQRHFKFCHLKKGSK